MEAIKFNARELKVLSEKYSFPENYFTNYENREFKPSTHLKKILSSRFVEQQEVGRYKIKVADVIKTTLEDSYRTFFKLLSIRATENGGIGYDSEELYALMEKEQVFLKQFILAKLEGGTTEVKKITKNKYSFSTVKIIDSHNSAILSALCSLISSDLNTIETEQHFISMRQFDMMLMGHGDKFDSCYRVGGMYMSAPFYLTRDQNAFMIYSIKNEKTYVKSGRVFCFDHDEFIFCGRLYGSGFISFLFSCLNVYVNAMEIANANKHAKSIAKLTGSFNYQNLYPNQIYTDDNDHSTCKVIFNTSREALVNMLSTTKMPNWGKYYCPSCGLTSECANQHSLFCYECENEDDYDEDDWD